MTNATGRKEKKQMSPLEVDLQGEDNGGTVARGPLGGRRQEVTGGEEHGAGPELLVKALQSRGEVDAVAQARVAHPVGAPGGTARWGQSPSK